MKECSDHSKTILEWFYRSKLMGLRKKSKKRNPFFMCCAHLASRGATFKAATLLPTVNSWASLVRPSSLTVACWQLRASSLLPPGNRFCADLTWYLFRPSSHLSLSIYPFTCLFLHLAIFSCLHLSLHPFIYISLYISLILFLQLPNFSSLSLFIYFCIYHFISSSLSSSIYLLISYISLFICKCDDSKK